MARQNDMRFTIDTPSRITFDVVAFKLEEALSEGFTLTLELSSENAAVDFGKILDHSATLTIWRGETPVRYVNGLVSLFEQGATGFRRTRYRAVIEPMLSRAFLCSDWRIHQQVSIPEILASRIKELGITDYEQCMYGEHLVREYCVQHGETTGHFINRVAAEEGIYTAYEFSEKSHRLIHGDRVIVHGAIGGEPVIYNPAPGGDQPEPCLKVFRYAENVRTGRSLSRDYTYKHPRYAQEHRSEAANLDRQGRDYEKFHYPARYKQDAAGKPFNQTRLLALRNDAQVATVEGDDARLIPGMAFKLEGHPREEWNRSWRPVRMKHHGVQYTSQEEDGADAHQGTDYRYEAEIIPDDVEWKDARASMLSVFRATGLRCVAWYVLWGT